MMLQHRGANAPRSPRLCRGKQTRRRGMVLILVLVVIALLSLAGYTFSELMLAEYEAATLHGRSVQAHALADSGVEMARLFVAQEKILQEEAGGHYDNPDRFQGVLVIDDETPQGRGRFTIVAPRIEEGAEPGLRFGLEDESTRLNLNALLMADKRVDNGGRTLLMGLPGMTEDIADAILDWLDPDDEPRQFGAEIDEYSGFDPPYAPKNGPLETVEELLLVRGVTPYLLFGPDANRNGLLDRHEFGPVAETSDGSEYRGWASYLTLYSVESNLNAEGQPRIQLNGDDLEKLYEEVAAVGGPDWAAFIVAYRQFGPSRSNSSAKPIAGRKPDLKQKAKAPIANVLELIGAKVSAKLDGEKEATLLASPFANDPIAMNIYLPKLMDSFTATGSAKIPGRININQAPRAILLGIPGMNEAIVEKILAEREPVPPPERPGRNFETWILAEGLVTLSEMKAIMPYICCNGAVYRAQVVGYFEEGGPSARIEAVFDTSGGASRLLFWRDLSHLGRGYPLEALGIAAPQG